MSTFNLRSNWKPAGDQPKAIEAITAGLKKGMRHETLLGVTGSGKTFTAANVIAQYGKPTLVIAHNKTLAAQLAQEYREFFPDNAVHYFVSYYDFYQPEAYMPATDTYIEKEAMINEEIDRLRHASTQALLTRRDVIIVASVSCIYGLGSPEEYMKVNLKLERGMELSRLELIRKLIDIHFTRTSADLKSGFFRAVGNTVEIMPVSDKTLYRIEYRGPTSVISSIMEIDPVNRTLRGEPRSVFIFPAKHFVTSDADAKRAFGTIQAELKDRLVELEKAGKVLEAERLKRRVRYDLAMIKEVGYCNGIENYSRHFSGKMPGEPPDSLLSYFPRDNDGNPDFLTIIDESHVTVPQIRGMRAGDASRKQTLVDYGFRLPSARDNRPLSFEEFNERVGPVVFTSATPSDYEREVSEQIVEQVIRPTGLIDPEVEVRPILQGTSIQVAGMSSQSPEKVDKNLANFSKSSKTIGKVDESLHPGDLSLQAGDLSLQPTQKTKGKGDESSRSGNHSEQAGDAPFYALTKNDKNLVNFPGSSKATDEDRKSQEASMIVPTKKSAYKGQIFDFIEESEKVIAKGDRVLATTLTKKMAEDLSEFLKEKKIKAAYLHSDIKTIERINILTDFRKGKYDILVGVNLLREGLDLPEVSLIGILDADKEGFLRSETALIQTIGRAARNAAGRVILYADNMTGSMQYAIDETNRRRAIQIAYNKEHNITPVTIKKSIHDITDQLRSDHDQAVGDLVVIDSERMKSDPKGLVREKEEQMADAVRDLDFETAAILRDEIAVLRKKFNLVAPEKKKRWSKGK
jgi:excinuclease UvrABC helicase subunit UvrB